MRLSAPTFSASSAACLVGCVLLAAGVRAQVPPPAGFVTDRAGVIDAPVQRRITQLIEELREKTGAEIAVVTVESTAPLDDFSYAMQLAEAWKPGRKGEDTGLLMLVAVQDRKIRVITGYGLEGVLPDGLVGEIQDKQILPEFRAGRIGEGIWRGVSAYAGRIAAERGVTLTGAPAGARSRRTPGAEIPTWVIALVFIGVLLVMSRAGAGPGRFRRGRRGPVFFPGGFGGGEDRGFPGGFGGGGGGFGGFGGGGFGGGGAGRSW